MNSSAASNANTVNFSNWEKDAVVAFCLANRNYAENAMAQLFLMQEDDEKQHDLVKHRNRRGFTAGTVTRGSAMAKKVLAGEHLSDDELAVAAHFASIHRRQLVKICKQFSLPIDPTLVVRLQPTQ